MTVNLSDELNFAKFEKAFDWSNGKQGAQTGWLLDINLSKYCEDVKNIKGKSIQVLWNGSVDQNINGISLILLDTSSDANFYRELSNRKSVSFWNARFGPGSLLHFLKMRGLFRKPQSVRRLGKIFLSHFHEDSVQASYTVSAL